MLILSHRRTPPPIGLLHPSLVPVRRLRDSHRSIAYQRRHFLRWDQAPSLLHLLRTWIRLVRAVYTSATVEDALAQIRRHTNLAAIPSPLVSPCPLVVP